MDLVHAKDESELVILQNLIFLHGVLFNMDNDIPIINAWRLIFVDRKTK